MNWKGVLFPFPLACSELPHPFVSFPPVRCTLASDSAVLPMAGPSLSRHVGTAPAGPCPHPHCIELLHHVLMILLSQDEH